MTAPFRVETRKTRVTRPGQPREPDPERAKRLISSVAALPEVDMLFVDRGIALELGHPKVVARDF